MANRSDFFNAKLPRQYKRMLAMEQAYGWSGKQEYHTVKNLFINAHANHVGYKLKRNTADNRDVSDSE